MFLFLLKIVYPFIVYYAESLMFISCIVGVRVFCIEIVIFPLYDTRFLKSFQDHPSIRKRRWVQDHLVLDKSGYFKTL